MHIEEPVNVDGCQQVTERFAFAFAFTFALAFTFTFALALASVDGFGAQQGAASRHREYDGGDQVAHR